jgi:spore coat polysaccharide biosynthesis protein SpsF (cytidylyltransferase family)
MMIAVLQARMSSTRLPGKVMKPILGRPMVALQMERIARSRRIDRTVLATAGKPLTIRWPSWRRPKAGASIAATSTTCWRGSPARPSRMDRPTTWSD